MSRSLRVKQECLDTVKLALKRNGYPSQRSLAEDARFALATVSNFLTGKPVDFTTFEELCRRLALDWREIANLNFDGGSLQTEPLVESTSALSATSDDLPRYPDGAVPLGSPFYLERTKLTAQIDRELRKPGALVRIKAPREMGKTSLLLRVLDGAKRLGYRTVSLNMEQIDRDIFSDLDRFLRWLCANIAHQLQLKPQLDEYWDEDLGSKISCTNYFQNYLLQQIDTPLVLALDEVNQIFEHPAVARDFLPLLRSWFEEAKTLLTWQKLRSIVVHSTDIYVPLQFNQSPFNVGLPVQLGKFNSDEVRQLARCYGLDWSNAETEVRQLMDLVEGHPALVNTALYHLSLRQLTLTQLLETAPTSTGIYSNHLQRHRVILAAQPELLLALKAAIATTEPVSLTPLHAYKLSSLGLVQLVRDKAILGCELYRRAFRS